MPEPAADEEGIQCQSCDNQGWYWVGDPYDPEPEQCEFCYCEPNSKFNVRHRKEDAADEKSR